MKTSEWLREHYNEAIEYMKRADNEAMEAPHCQFAVIFDESREEEPFDIQCEAAGSNFHRIGWTQIKEYCYQNNPIQDFDERTYEKIYKESLYPRLSPKDRKYIQKDIEENGMPDDEYYYYKELIDHIKDTEKYSYAYEGYVNNLIEAFKDNITEDYYTDALDLFIEQCEYEEQLGEW